MASLATRVTVTFHPKWGRAFGVVFHVAPGIVDPNAAPVQAILAAINACTNAVALKIELSQVVEFEGDATAAADYVNEDKGFFQFVDEDGQAHNFRVPGIKPALLSANQETIALSGVAGAYADAVVANALGVNGATITAAIRAYRRESRKLIKQGNVVS